MKKLLVILITSCLFFSGCLQSSNDLYLYGTEYKNPPDAPDFTLLNQDGESVTLSDYYDKVVSCCLHLYFMSRYLSCHFCQSCMGT